MTSQVEAELDWGLAIAWRLRRQSLVTRAPFADLVSVVSRLGGLHAQVLSSAIAALAARVDRADEEAVGRALWSDRSMVKLWAMRGTLHLLPATDHPTWVAGMDLYSSAYGTTGCATLTYCDWPNASVRSCAIEC